MVNRLKSAQNRNSTSDYANAGVHVCLWNHTRNSPPSQDSGKHRAWKQINIDPQIRWSLAKPFRPLKLQRFAFGPKHRLSSTASGQAGYTRWYVWVYTLPKPLWFLKWGAELAYMACRLPSPHQVTKPHEGKKLGWPTLLQWDGLETALQVQSLCKFLTYRANMLPVDKAWWSTLKHDESNNAVEQSPEPWWSKLPCWVESMKCDSQRINTIQTGGNLQAAGRHGCGYKREIHDLPANLHLCEIWDWSEPHGMGNLHCLMVEISYIPNFGSENRCNSKETDN